MDQSHTKLIVILGPTSSGKSDLGITMAKKFNGEIISADSRQVYAGLDIGTGKVTRREQKEVRHHLLDVIQPPRRWKEGQQPFTLAQYQKHAMKAICDIVRRGKVPFLVGGTGLYIKALVEGYEIPIGDYDSEYRMQLEKKSVAQLAALLKRVDSAAYAVIDIRNPRRIIRALEVKKQTGKSIVERKKNNTLIDVLMIGIDLPRDILYNRVDSRVDARIKIGMVAEVRRLLNRNISKPWLSSLGLEYRHITQYLEGPETTETKTQMIQNLKYDIHSYVRRQMTWFRKEKNIHWISSRMSPETRIREFLQ